MKYPYLRLPTADGRLGHPMPYLRTMLKGPRGYVIIDMLVDSGAEETLVPLHIAQDLGISPTGEKRAIGGFDAVQIQADVGEVQIQFGQRWKNAFTTRFLTHESVKLACLGHREFFERWRVCFDSRKKLFRVSEHWG